MGSEARARITIDGAAAEAKVLLETEEIIVRGGPRLRIPFSDIEKLTADDGVLRFRIFKKTGDGWNPTGGST